MKLPTKTKTLVIFAVLLELLVFCICYISYSETAEVFRHAARYSGRIALLLWLVPFLYLAFNYHKLTTSVIAKLKRIVIFFCVCHLIHFGFLATNIYLNEIPLVPFKVAGGFLGYMMIMGYPFIINKIKRKGLHLVYFYYLGIVIAMTYVARIKGDFQGVTPSTVHYLGFGTALTVMLLSTILIIVKKPRTYVPQS